MFDNIKLLNIFYFAAHSKLPWPEDLKADLLLKQMLFLTQMIFYFYYFYYVE